MPELSEAPQIDTEVLTETAVIPEMIDQETTAAVIPTEVVENPENVINTEITVTPEIVDVPEAEPTAEAADTNEETVPEEIVEEPVIVEVIESEDEIAEVYESQDADSLMAEDLNSDSFMNESEGEESQINADPVDVVIRDLGEYDELSGEVNGVISIARDRFELPDDVFSGLVFVTDDENIAKLTERSIDDLLAYGIELQLLNAGETKLVIKQAGSGEILREIRLVVTAAPEAEEPDEAEMPTEEFLMETVETAEFGEPTVEEEVIFEETEAELVFSIAPGE